MKKFFPTLLLIIVISSCINMNDPKEQAEYIRALKTYHSSLTIHIPGKIPNNSVGYSISSNLVGRYSNFYIRTKEKREKYYAIKKRYVYAPNRIVASSDSSFIRVAQYDFRTDSLQSHFGKSHKLIVPKDLYEENNLNFTSSPIEYNFDIVVLGCIYNTLVSKTDYDDIKINVGSSASNYSKGLAFYDKDLIITYWVITW